MTNKKRKGRRLKRNVEAPSSALIILLYEKRVEHKNNPAIVKNIKAFLFILLESLLIRIKKAKTATKMSIAMLLGK